MPGGGAHESADCWTNRETLALLQLWLVYGSQWVLIGRALQRSRSSVRNKFQRLKHCAYTTEQSKGIRKCKVCGMLKRGHVCTAVESCDMPLDRDDDSMSLDTDTILDMWGDVEI